MKERDKAISFLVDNAARLFFGSVYYVRSKYSVYFWGSEAECMLLYKALRFGGVYEPKQPINGHTHMWYSNGPNAIEFSKEIKPLLESGDYEARRRAAFCQ